MAGFNFGATLSEFIVAELDESGHQWYSCKKNGVEWKRCKACSMTDSQWLNTGRQKCEGEKLCGCGNPVSTTDSMDLPETDLDGVVHPWKLGWCQACLDRQREESIKKYPKVSEVIAMLSRFDPDSRVGVLADCCRDSHPVAEIRCPGDGDDDFPQVIIAT